MKSSHKEKSQGDPPKVDDSTRRESTKGVPLGLRSFGKITTPACRTLTEGGQYCVVTDVGETQILSQ